LKSPISTQFLVETLKILPQSPSIAGSANSGSEPITLGLQRVATVASAWSAEGSSVPERCVAAT